MHFRSAHKCPLFEYYPKSSWANANMTDVLPVPGGPYRSKCGSYISLTQRKRPRFPPQWISSMFERPRPGRRHRSSSWDDYEINPPSPLPYYFSTHGSDPVSFFTSFAAGSTSILLRQFLSALFGKCTAILGCVVCSIQWFYPRYASSVQSRISSSSIRYRNNCSVILSFKACL